MPEPLFLVCRHTIAENFTVSNSVVPFSTAITCIAFYGIDNCPRSLSAPDTSYGNPPSSCFPPEMHTSPALFSSHQHLGFSQHHHRRTAAGTEDLRGRIDQPHLLIAHVPELLHKRLHIPVHPGFHVIV